MNIKEIQYKYETNSFEMHRKYLVLSQCYLHLSELSQCAPVHKTSFKGTQEIHLKYKRNIQKIPKKNRTNTVDFIENASFIPMLSPSQ